MALSGRDRLKQYLKRSKQKQRQLAQQIGFTESYLSQLLSGKRTPGRVNALRIEEETGVPVGSWSELSIGDQGHVPEDSGANISLAKS